MTNIGNSIPGQWSNPPLKAVYINWSLHPDAKDSHTQRLIERSAGIMTTEAVRDDLAEQMSWDAYAESIGPDPGTKRLGLRVHLKAWRDGT